MAERKSTERYLERYGQYEAPMHEAFSLWTEDQANRPGSRMVPLPYDPVRYPEQSLAEIVTPAKDFYPKLSDEAFYFGWRVVSIAHMGLRNYNSIMRQLTTQPASSEDSTPLPDAILNRQRQGRNVLVIVPHLDQAEMMYCRALEVQAKKDRHNIANSSAIYSKLMTRQSYRGKTPLQKAKPVIERSRKLFNVIYTLQDSENARKFGVPPAAIRGGAALGRLVLDKQLEKPGQEIIVTPTGSDIVRLRDDHNAIIGYSFPDIQEGAASLIQKAHDILGVSVMKHPSTSEIKLYASDLLPVDELLKQFGTPENLMLDYFRKFQTELERFTGLGVEKAKIGRKLGQMAVDSA